jgi:hypothetical protein
VFRQHQNAVFAAGKKSSKQSFVDSLLDPEWELTRIHASGRFSKLAAEAKREIDLTQVLFVRISSCSLRVRESASEKDPREGYFGQGLM